MPCTLCKKIRFEKHEVKPSIYYFRSYIKVIQKVFKLTFFNANTKILTLVSDYERFMLVKVQFMIVEAWLKVNCANELAVCCVKK